MHTPTFQEIIFGSPQYDQECNLRDTVLRQPLGLSLYNENLETEQDQTHYGLFDHSSNLIACLIAVPLSTNTIKLRQMAVSPSHQGKGNGSTLLKHIENQLLQNGIHNIQLHARTTAIPFYKKAGYQENSPIFIEVSLPHLTMSKILKPTLQ